MFKGILFVLLLVSTSFLFSDEGKRMDIPFIEERVKIDGQLTETLYKDLVPVENFYQFHPENGAKHTFKTQLYFLRWPRCLSRRFPLKKRYIQTLTSCRYVHIDCNRDGTWSTFS
jgi:hypothetical protein